VRYMEISMYLSTKLVARYLVKCFIARYTEISMYLTAKLGERYMEIFMYLARCLVNGKKDRFPQLPIDLPIVLKIG